MEIAGDGSAVVGRMVLVDEFVQRDFVFVLDAPVFLQAGDRVVAERDGVTITPVVGEPYRPTGGGAWRCRRLVADAQ